MSDISTPDSQSDDPAGPTREVPVTKGCHVVDALPELPLEPFEVAGTLAHARRGPFLTIVPPERPAPAPPKALPHAAPRAQFEVRKYYSQVIYPRLICIDPGDLIEGIQLDHRLGTPGSPAPAGPAAVHRDDVAALAKVERHYKLTKLNGNALHHALWCTVKYGPWLAIVFETESCTDGVPNRWELGIAEVPEVGMLWYGQWLDQPAYPNLTVIKGNLAPAGVSRLCCGGYQWCPTTESCIPIQVNCQPPVPV